MAGPGQSGPSPTTQWIPTRWGRKDAAELATMALAYPVGFGILVFVMLPTSPFIDISGIWGVLLYVYAIGLGPAVLIPFYFWIHPTSIGLTDGGLVIVRRVFSRRVVEWALVRPGFHYPPGLSFRIRWLNGRGHSSSPMALSKEQATALLGDSRTPWRLFPPEAWKTLGLNPPDPTDLHTPS
jgi:hypothetical protein